MNRNMQSPDAMLSRANEFIDVGKPKMALELMEKVFCHKSWAYNWSESNLEPFMLKYLNLCVDLKNSQAAKEGLYQYRNVFLTSNPGTVENVVRNFLKTAETKVESVRLEATSEAVVELDDDLDDLAIHVKVLESAISGNGNNEILNQGMLTPWVKFIWDAYCNCLELLRNNNLVALLYRDVTKMTFAFCKSYNRKMEFRKLGDKLRKHVDMAESKDANKKLHLEVRFEQLDCSLEMKLWQEAYKVIGDIKQLMNLFAKIPNQMMENYYEKLALVFWNSENHLFHAASLFKLFQLYRGIGSTTEDKLKMIASRVVIATLSIPLSSTSTVNFGNFFEDDSTLGKDKKSLDLLNFSRLPTRRTLLSDIVESNVLNFAAPEIQHLYNCLEVTFDPLSLCTRMETLMNLVPTQENSLMFQYVSSIRTVTLSLLINQIAQAYETVTLERLLQLSKFSSLAELEHLLIRHRTDQQVRIDHRSKCVHFGSKTEMFERETSFDGPMLQTNFNANLSNHLRNVYAALHKGVAVIKHNEIKEENDSVRKNLIEIYHATKVEERKRTLERQSMIEKRLACLDVEKNEDVEKVKQEEINAKKRVEEEVRRKKEQEERERERKRKVEIELNRRKNEELQEKAKIELLQKQRRELETKRKGAFKKIDYLERAKRLMEIPLIEEYLKKRETLDEAVWIQGEKERIRALVKERKDQLSNKKRLELLKEEKDVFFQMCSTRTDNEFDETMKKFNEVLSGERAKCLEERRKVRMEERRTKWMEERQKELKRKEMEELRLRKEEEERKVREERQKLELTAAKQKQKDDEIEKRLERDRGVYAKKNPWRKDGGEQQKSSGSYVPPHLRGAQQSGSSNNNEKKGDRRDDRADKRGKTYGARGSGRENVNSSNNWRKR